MKYVFDPSAVESNESACIPCVLCGTPVQDPDEVCEDCEGLVEISPSIDSGIPYCRGTFCKAWKNNRCDISNRTHGHCEPMIKFLWKHYVDHQEDQ